MIKPFHNNVLLKKLPVEKMTSFGILLLNDESPTFDSEVMAVGPDAKGPEVGQVVIINSFARKTEIKEGKETYILVMDKEVMGAYEKTVTGTDEKAV